VEVLCNKLDFTIIWKLQARHHLPLFVLFGLLMGAGTLKALMSSMSVATMEALASSDLFDTMFQKKNS
jgi:hypothetical protein